MFFRVFLLNIDWNSSFLAGWCKLLHCSPAMGFNAMDSAGTCSLQNHLMNIIRLSSWDG